MKNTFIWSARIIALLFIAFISLFAFDSFSGEESFVAEIGHFLMHLVPTFVLVVCLVIAWKNPPLGGFLFIGVAILFTIYFGTFKQLETFFMISVPPIIAGILFLLSWNNKAANS